MKKLSVMQYSEKKIPYSAQIFRTSIFFSGAIYRRKRLKKKWHRLPAVQRLRTIIKY